MRSEAELWPSAQWRPSDTVLCGHLVQLIHETLLSNTFSGTINLKNFFSASMAQLKNDPQKWYIVVQLIHEAT